MELTFREGVVEDFEAWFAMECACFQRTSDWRENAWREWNTLFASAGFLTLVMEDLLRPPEQRMVAFGGGALVSDKYVAWLRQGQAPYVLVHATNPLPDCSNPLLNRAQIRTANSGNGLNFLFTHWTWAEPNLTPEEALHVRITMGERFFWMHGGYQLKELLTEGFGEAHLNRSETAGFEIINDYAAYYRANPPEPEPEYRPYLLGVTREQALRKDGSALCRSFLFSPPQIGFTEAEQKMLCLARSDKSDVQISELLDLSGSTIKRRWRDIYDRVRTIRPTLLPPQPENGRGPESRRILLEYLDAHPEELRPYFSVLNRRKRKMYTADG